MKKLLTLRNIILCCSFVLALAVFIMSFLAAFRYVTSGLVTTTDTTYNGIVWGSTGTKTIVTSGGSSVITETKFDKPYDASVMGLIGSLLVFVGAIAAVVVALVVKDKKVRRIAMIVAGAVVAVGAIFTFFTVESFYASYAKAHNVTVEKVKESLKDANAQIHCALPVVMGILGLISGGGIVVSEFVKK